MKRWAVRDPSTGHVYAVRGTREQAEADVRRYRVMAAHFVERERAAAESAELDGRFRVSGRFLDWVCVDPVEIAARLEVVEE